MPLNLLGRWASRPAPPARALPDGARRIVLLEEGRTPSGDYLLHPWAAQFGAVHCIDVRNAPPPAPLQAGDFVVIARYLHPEWRPIIDASRAQLAGMAFFIDDDLFDTAAHQHLGKAYAAKLRRMASSQQHWLRQRGCALWVSTPALAQKYADWSPVLIPLAPAPALVEPAAAMRLAYHGTASHGREIAWLRDVIAAVQSQCDNTHFTLFGDLDVNRAYRDIPRVAVLYPMRWESYLAYTAAHRADIGLAPLLPGAFNAARGPVKFYDYARMGAFGLYSNQPPYAGWINDGEDGLLLPLDAARWVDTLTALCGDAGLCARLAAAAVRRARAPAPSVD